MPVGVAEYVGGFPVGTAYLDDLSYLIWVTYTLAVNLDPVSHIGSHAATYPFGLC